MAPPGSEVTKEISEWDGDWGLRAALLSAWVGSRRLPPPAPPWWPPPAAPLWLPVQSPTLPCGASTAQPPWPWRRAGRCRHLRWEARPGRLPENPRRPQEPAETPGTRGDPGRICGSVLSIYPQCPWGGGDWKPRPGHQHLDPRPSRAVSRTRSPACPRDSGACAPASPGPCLGRGPPSLPRPRGHRPSDLSPAPATSPGESFRPCRTCSWAGGGPRPLPLALLSAASGARPRAQPRPWLLGLAPGPSFHCSRHTEGVLAKPTGITPLLGSLGALAGAHR